MIIGTRFTFEAAHSLPNHNGHCKRLHGHSYKLEVKVEGKIISDNTSPETGMVSDFSRLKATVKSELDKWDHTNLNDRFENPTAEVMCTYLALALQKKLSVTPVKLVSLKLWETENNFVQWEAKV